MVKKLSVGAGTKSKLAKPVQELIKLIFDVESMKKAMVEFEVCTLYPRGVVCFLERGKKCLPFRIAKIFALLFTHPFSFSSVDIDIVASYYPK